MKQSKSVTPRAGNSDLDRWSDLSKAKRHMEKELERAKLQAYTKPLGGWSQEKHDAYFAKYCEELGQAIGVIQRMMLAINPD